MEMNKQSAINKVFPPVLPVIFLTVLLILIPGTGPLSATGIPERPLPPRLVNDLAGILSAAQAGSLERKLVDFDNSTYTQIAVITVNSLEGYDRADFAIRVGEKWEVGEAGFNNGVVILVKPRRGNERGEAFIATGYGLEGVIPDAIARRIVENEMIPHFRNDNYFEGISAATGVIMKLSLEEFSAREYMESTEESPYAALIILIIFMVIFFSAFGRARRIRGQSIGHSIPFWLLMSMMGSSSRTGRGSFGNFSSGRGSFGGGAAGSFRGFGGGSFGGGGAGGSW